MWFSSNHSRLLKKISTTHYPVFLQESDVVKAYFAMIIDWAEDMQKETENTRDRYGCCPVCYNQRGSDYIAGTASIIISYIRFFHEYGHDDYSLVSL